MPDDSSALIPASPDLYLASLLATYPDLLIERSEANREIFEIGPDGHTLRMIAEHRQRLSQDTQQYSLGLNALKFEREAYDVAYCGTFVSMDRFCPDKAYAHASQMHCHDAFCRGCGRRHFQLGQWGRDRDLQALVNEPQIGIEIVLPIKEPCDACAPPVSANARPSHPTSKRCTHHLSPQRLREERARLAALSAKLVRKLGNDAVCMDNLSPARRDVRVRIAARALSVSYRDVSAAWKQIAGDAAWCEIRMAGAGAEGTALLEWVFAGLEEILVLPGADRALYRDALRDTRFIRTYGDYYSPLSKEELDERRARKKLEHKHCPAHKVPHLIEVAPQDRRRQTLEEMEEEFAVVDLSSDYNPFRVLRVRHKGPLMDNFDGPRPASTQQPRYGPN